MLRIGGFIRMSGVFCLLLLLARLSREGHFSDHCCQIAG